jgi:uncharacterized membrane protein AbrB (regulator of aidB expression)
MSTPHKSTPAAFSLRYRPLALQWSLLLAASLAFIVPLELVHLPAALLLGALLARWKVLPGTTAVWGSAPGAATVMVLMAGCYAVVGWIIGLRFTREIVVYAARMLPRITTSILMLIIVCGGLAWVLHLALGTDMLTAYLATSPGGADSIAIIAASSKVDLPFVMAMQTARFLLVILIGPSLARMVARRTQA